VYVQCRSVIYLCNIDYRQFAVDCDAHTTKQGKYTLDRVVIINMEVMVDTLEPIYDKYSVSFNIIGTVVL
jgi:hypothetical protein